MLSTHYIAKVWRIAILSPPTLSSCEASRNSRTSAWSQPPASSRLSGRRVTFHRKDRAHRQADIYSLGKVLYEISMGKDRLDFPELGTNLDERADKHQLLQLNQVLLKACAHNPGRRYATAEQMRRDLARVGEGRRKFHLSRILVPLAIVAAFIVAIVVLRNCATAKSARSAHNGVHRDRPSRRDGDSRRSNGT